MKGVDSMNERDRNNILNLRAKGMSFLAIAESLGISVGTVKTVCSRNKDTIEQKKQPQSGRNCLACGAPLDNSVTGSRARFCNQRCYYRWWQKQAKNPRKEYKKTCPNCHKTFFAASKKSQKYCSRDCFYAARKAGGEGE